MENELKPLRKSSEAKAAVLVSPWETYFAFCRYQLNVQGVQFPLWSRNQLVVSLSEFLLVCFCHPCYKHPHLSKGSHITSSSGHQPMGTPILIFASHILKNIQESRQAHYKSVPVEYQAFPSKVVWQISPLCCCSDRFDVLQFQKI